VTRFSEASFGVHASLSLIGLMVAVFLLVEAIAVRKLASGGVVAQRIELVVLASVCLAASALAEWATVLVVDLTLEQVQLAAEVLVIVAMALMAMYFWNVAAVMKGYMANAASMADELSEAPAPSDPAEPE
jgi:hypothetical protein